MDLRVDQRIPTHVRDGVGPICIIFGKGGAVDEGLACVADLEVVGCTGKVFAPRDGHAAEPLLVGVGAVVAADSERVH